MTPPEYASPAVVPRWLCTVGTRVVVVAAERENDARAIVRERLRERSLMHDEHDVRVRRLRAGEDERLEDFGRERL